VVVPNHIRNLKAVYTMDENNYRYLHKFVLPATVLVLSFKGAISNIPTILKGTVSRDFRPSVFFIKQFPLGP
jgi:hypothetical protein